jgi:hypothetical protein
MTVSDLQKIINSWENLMLTIDYISEHPEHIDMLMAIAMNDTVKDSWRASWIVSKIYEKNPGQLEGYIGQIIDFLQKTDNASKKREFLKLISYYPVPKEKIALMLEYGIRHFTSACEPIAVRVHAMQILFNISESEPELKPELIQLIEQEMEYHPSAGIKSRGNKLLRKLYQQTNGKSTN